MLSLLVAGVIAGLVLSGRATDQPEIAARTPDAPVAAERATGQAVAPAPSGGPDFTRVAAQTVGQGPMKKRVKGRLVQYLYNGHRINLVSAQV